jgi:hypothetical protein
VLGVFALLLICHLLPSSESPAESVQTLLSPLGGAIVFKCSTKQRTLIENACEDTLGTKYTMKFWNDVNDRLVT